ncbi:MAG TPA: hypothetical protein VLV83_20765 [Acidobacteriota bacterium]|nr:hypothetical protein [Acidobacteriota bacterium]
MAGTQALNERLSHVAGRISRISGQLDALRDQLDESRAEFEEGGRPAAAAAPAAPGQLELEYVNETLRKLLYGESQEEILDIFLEEAQSFVQRAILFLQREGKYVTWKSYGFDAESIRDIELDDPSDAIVRSAQQRQLIYRRDHPTDSMPWLAGTGNLPRATFCVPLVFENSVPVVFYGDSDDSIAIDSLELLTHLTVLVLKNNYLQQLAAGAQPTVVEAPPQDEAPAEEAPAHEAGAEEAAEEASVEEPPVEEPPLQEPAREEPSDAGVAEHAAVAESVVPEPPMPEAVEPEAEPAPPEFTEERVEQDDYREVAETSFEQASEEPQPDADEVTAAAVGVVEEEAQAQEAAPEAEADDFDFELPEEEEVKFEIDLDTTPEVEEVMAEAAQDAGQEAEAAVEQEEPQEAEDELAAETVEIEQPWARGDEADEEPEEFQEARPPDEDDFQAAPEPEPEREPEGEEAEQPEGVSFEVPPEPQFEPEFEPQFESQAEEAAEQEAQPEPESEPEPVSSLSSEEEKKVHDDARRFARLLVSEIKLYNEEQVENGRVNADLYDRLTRDIDRSRDMYNKRVHPEVARSVDYFHEEMVRILAKGDESLLGDSYPGPQR